MTGVIAAEGTLTITIKTDRFPSFGLQVERDGQQIYGRTIYNAACNTMTGPAGATRLVIGLNTQTIAHQIVIPPGGNPSRGLPTCTPIKVSKAEIARTAANALKDGQSRMIVNLMRAYIEKLRARPR